MLTTREIDVLALLARGCSYSAIGERLGISSHTVASHVKNTYRKLEVHCAAAAVMRAIELRALAPALSEPGISAREAEVVPAAE
jgi:DNA-binding NarL/FixJ family response regulator